MSEVFFSIQAALTAYLLVVVIRRCRVLLFEAPASRAFVDALSQSIDERRDVYTLHLARAYSRGWVSRLVLEASEGEPADRLERIDMLLADLRMEASSKLTLLRVSATISSTVGLMSGILAIQYGFSGKGLLSLSAGLAQQVALNRALSHMAVGMGTAAFCFAAFGLLRVAARDVLAQVAHIAARYRVAASERGHS